MKEKILTLRDLNGIMDSRSNPESMPPDSLRFKLNMAVDEDGRLTRRPGWARFLDTLNSTYKNEDWHDQGDCFNLSPTRENVTRLHEHISTAGARRLFLGTMSRVAVLDQRNGEWITIGRDFGPTGSDLNTRWKVASNGNDLVFVNGYDKPQIYTAGNLPGTCGENMMSTIDELEDDIKMTRANYVASFRGYTILLGTFEDGTDYPSRVRWCGLNNARKWFATTDPGTGESDTTAGFIDLPYGTRILGAANLLNSLYIFTNQSIWKMTLTGGNPVFKMTEIYTEPTQQDRCLVYPNTLVSTGEDIYYMSREGIYRYNPYMRIPDRVEWIHRGSNQIYDFLDKTCCESPVAGYHAGAKEYWVSFPRSGGGCVNSRTFVVDLKYKTSDVVDHGFTAFGSFRSDNSQTLTEWLAQYCDGDLDSICANIGSKEIADFCAGNADNSSGTQCNEEQVFAAVSAEDYCIKEIGNVWVRERCSNAATGTGSVDSDDDHLPFDGTYVSDGYFSIARGIFPLKKHEKESIIKHFLIEPRPLADEIDPPMGRLRIGYSYDSVDPNSRGNPLAIGYREDGEFHTSLNDVFTAESGYCEVVWNQQDPKALDCPLDTKDARTQRSENLKAGLGTEWPLWYRDRFLYWEFSVVEKDVVGQFIEPTGGAFIFSRIEARLMQ